jgi:NAD(P)-dependent dehydrogenase (short-subunit alcohol dehydrogenase family)
VSQVVVVTGASSGVGRAAAVAFARTGARVGLIARGARGLEGARRDVEAAGGTGLILEADVADADALESAAARAEGELGPIDVWVNNAMVTIFAPFSEIEPDEFRRVTEVTYLGFVYGTMAALKRMKPRDRGTIVQVGSALAYRGIPLQTAYCGAKHAIQGFNEALRAELLHEGSNVRLTMVQMPALNTPQFDHCRSKMPRKAMPVPPIYQPELAAEAILWAAKHARREVYVGGPTAAVIVGDKVASGLGDRYLAKTNFEAQQTPEPQDPDAPDNLFEPLAEDPGAHGRFDDVSKPRSVQWWLTSNRDALIAAVGACLVAAGLHRSA